MGKEEIEKIVSRSYYSISGRARKEFDAHIKYNGADDKYGIPIITITYKDIDGKDCYFEFTINNIEKGVMVVNSIIKGYCIFKDMKKTGLIMKKIA